MEKPSSDSFMSNVLNRLMLIITLIALIVGVTFAFLYKQQQSALTNLSIENNSLLIAKANLEKDIESKNRIQKVSEEAIKQLSQDLQEKNEILSGIERDIDRKITAIIKKYDALPKTDANKIAMEREISSERIKGAWLFYCKQNPQHERCK